MFNQNLKLNLLSSPYFESKLMDLQPHLLWSSELSALGSLEAYEKRGRLFHACVLFPGSLAP